MPWRLSTDQRRFRQLTTGKPVIMGRKTWESLRGPLRDRTNIVVTRHPGFAADGAESAGSLDEAIAWAEAAGAGEIMMIGGGEIYAEAIARADRLYVTHVHAEPPGDTRFPAIDPDAWVAASRENVPAGDKDSAATTYVRYERRSPPRR